MDKFDTINYGSRWTQLKQQLSPDQINIVMSGNLKPHLSINPLQVGPPPATCGASDKDGVIRYCWQNAKDCYEVK
jgi:hypothetical protein